MAGFLLGLSTGLTCLAYCGPVLVPYLAGEAGGYRRSLAALILFLFGRLGGYLIFAVLAWAAHLLVLLEAGSARYAMISGAAYLVLGILLAVWGLRRPGAVCAGVRLHKEDRSRAWLGTLFPALLGFLTGLNLCPPFLLALAGAAGTGSLFDSAIFFISFFFGTSVFMLPLPFLGFLSRREACRIVGRLAGGVVAIYYLYLGVITLAGGIMRS